MAPSLVLLTLVPAFNPSIQTRTVPVHHVCTELNSWELTFLFGIEGVGKTRVVPLPSTLTWLAPSPPPHFPTNLTWVCSTATFLLVIFLTWSLYSQRRQVMLGLTVIIA